VQKISKFTDDEFIAYYKQGEGFGGVSDFVDMLREAIKRLENRRLELFQSAKPTVKTPTPQSLQ
jgi:hypothetical protein